MGTLILWLFKTLLRMTKETRSAAHVAGDAVDFFKTEG
jgi:hypothetical protein